jgi:protoheme IX farnesyltransferase
MTRIERFFTLAKGPVALLASLSAVTGFVLAGGGVSFQLFLFVCAIILLAAGTAILNQYQERRSDAVMERTKRRPIPNGDVTPAVALAVALSAIVSGFGLLRVMFGDIPVVLGILSVGLYNGLYTYLKKKSSFASIPGALAGALPPLMGFTAAGGALTDPMVLWLLGFFYIWQIPHFWLLMGIHGEDYRKAHFPSLGDRFAIRGLGRVIFNWIIATVCVALLFPLFGEIRHSVVVVLLTGLAMWTGWRVWPLTRRNNDVIAVFRQAFMVVNRFVLATMILFIIDRGV